MPAGALVVALRHDIASLVGPTFAGAGVLIAILSLGRAVEAATGPSQALQEMLTRSRVSLVNGLIGFAVTALMMLWMTPHWGSVGAAIATAIGINVPSLLSLQQINKLYGLQPYDRRLIRPAIWSFSGAAMIFIAVAIVGSASIAIRMGVGATAFFAAYILLLRFGFSDRDAAVFGKFARWIRN
nr:polysaccharide biosynthesis C-terminal domain-containing protein [Govania unica]